ncbi:hypothetical protein EON67_06260 [archaeon]|nr:MAG: hypothetical protein EON67_06260 [archaeon]
MCACVWPAAPDRRRLRSPYAARMRTRAVAYDHQRSSLHTRAWMCSYLGYVDMYGTSFSEDILATGMGTHLALPLIRERWSADMSEGEARALLEDCMRVCWYRDTRALNKITLAKVTSEGSLISEPYTLDTKWDFKSFVAPKAATDTGGSW